MSTIVLDNIVAYNSTNFTGFNLATNLLTFGDALNNVWNSTNTAVLFTDGCGSTRDCTTACRQVDQAFRNAATLQNCMQYPIIAAGIDSLDPNSDSLFLAQEMGIYNGTYADAVYEVVSGCLNSYFEVASILPGAPPLGYGKPRCLGPNHTTNEGRCYLDLCDPSYLYAPLNADIGGTGVYVSYYMQIGFAIGIYVLMKLFTSWAYWITRVVFSVAGNRKSKEWAHSLQKKAEEHLDPLVSTAVEFQKAQCIFMLAVQMAALIVLHKNNLLETSSLQQVYNDYYLIGAIAIGGFLPITFTLATLHICDLRSWYLFILSGATIAVSISTMFVAQTFSPHPDDVGPAPIPSKECGTANPIKFCLEKDEGRLATWTLFRGTGLDNGGPSGAGNSIMLFCLIIYFLLFVDLCLHTFTKFEKKVRRAAEGVKRSNTASSLQRQRKKASKWLPKRAESFRFMQLLLWLIYVSAVAAYFFFFYYYIADLRVPLVFVSTGNWTFGQIVAITIWAPALFEWLYLETRGMKKGFLYKMTKRWKLVEIDPDSKEEGLLGHTDPSHISEFMQHPWQNMLGVGDSHSHSLVSQHDDSHSLVDNPSHSNEPTPSLPPIDNTNGRLSGHESD